MHEFQIKTFNEQTGLFWEMVFSNDGKFLSTANDVETRILRVDDGEAVFIGKNSCP